MIALALFTSHRSVETPEFLHRLRKIETPARLDGTAKPVAIVRSIRLVDRAVVARIVVFVLKREVGTRRFDVAVPTQHPTLAVPTDAVDVGARIAPLRVDTPDDRDHPRGADKSVEVVGRRLNRTESRRVEGKTVACVKR